MSHARPPVPREEGETVRRKIRSLLEEADAPLSAKEISAAAGIPEKDVGPHLEHLRRSLEGTGAREGRGTPGRLAVEPARCNGCGFVFRKRERLRKPGRCPLCKGESIDPPRFLLG